MSCLGSETKVQSDEESKLLLSLGSWRLVVCLPILQYLASRTKVIHQNKDKEGDGDHHAFDIKYVEFFSVR